MLPPADLTEITAKYNTLANSATTPAWTGTSVTEVTAGGAEAGSGPSEQPGTMHAQRRSRYANSHQTAYYAFEAKSRSRRPRRLPRSTTRCQTLRAEDFTASGLAHLRGTLAFLVGQNEVKNFSIASWQTPVGG